MFPRVVQVAAHRMPGVFCFYTHPRNEQQPALEYKPFDIVVDSIQSEIQGLDVAWHINLQPETCNRCFKSKKLKKFFEIAFIWTLSGGINEIKTGLAQRQLAGSDI